MATFRDLLSRGVKHRWMIYTASMAAANIFAGTVAAVLLRWVLPIQRSRYVVENSSLIYGSALAYLLLGAVVSTLAAIVMLGPAARWYRRGGTPTAAEQSSVMFVPLRQAIIHTVLWLIGAVAFTALHYPHDPEFAITGLIVITLVCVGTFGASYMLGERILRPAAARALSDGEYAPRYAPPISIRILLTWGIGTLLPTIGVLALAIAHLAGWIDTTNTAFAAAIITMCVLIICTSLFLAVLTSSHLSDPVRQLRSALLDLRNDVRGVHVDVYDGSELGMLQVGFNNMVSAVEERRHLRTLFGKHVGADVVRLALENGTELGGETRFVAALFVDMIASTRLAAARPPTEVMDVLNQFFQVVIEVVHRNNGFINKFVGDEVFVVFGAPLVLEDPCTSVLRTAREIHEELLRRTGIDAGIGLSSGICVAGNVGAAERLEYTVIGDAVNEAARLTDLAKLHGTRISASYDTVCSASDDERAHWQIGEDMVLRGRSRSTVIAHPCSGDGGSESRGAEPSYGPLPDDAPPHPPDAVRN